MDALDRLLAPTDRFASRHLGPSPEDREAMLDLLGFDSLDALSDAAVPSGIQLDRDLDLPPARTEQQLLALAHERAGENQTMRSFIGMGYYGTHTPPVILRNVLENPGWYTQYTPYQAEIAQGRLEALLNFQTAVADLTGLPVANASLLDEGTAAAEAMTMFFGAARGKRDLFFVDERCHPQTIAVVQQRAEPQGIRVEVGDWATFTPEAQTAGASCVGALVQYPTTDGEVVDYKDFADRIHEAGGLLAVATDLLALTLLEAPGTWGADVAVGSSQRFGVPMGFGGPHAAFFATTDDFKRKIPGRIIGVSQDRHGDTALRMALQTREQHIRREKATSNICTAQVLLANIAGFYAVYHGPDGLTEIAERVHRATQTLANALSDAGHTVASGAFFDTIRVTVGKGTREGDERTTASGAELAGARARRVRHQPPRLRERRPRHRARPDGHARGSARPGDALRRHAGRRRGPRGLRGASGASRPHSWSTRRSTATAASTRCCAT